MDAYKAAKIVFSRIQILDPENAAKIMGLLLLQEHGEMEMIRLALGPESLLHSVVLRAWIDIGLLPHSAILAGSLTTTGPAVNPFLPARQNSTSRLRIPLSPILSPSAWTPPSSFSRFADDIQYGGYELIEEIHLHDQLSFLNDTVVSKCTSGNDAYHPEECRSPMGDKLFPYGMGWSTPAKERNPVHTSSISDLCIGSDPNGFAWKPCLYFARGYCKNGTTCRFLHGLSDDTAASIEHDLLLSSKCQRLMASPLSPSATSKCMNFLLQQQSKSQRVAAATMMLGGEDPLEFMSPTRTERSAFTSAMMNPGSRQIYLTFPAHSTFREEDVSGYFGIYGPVQDVRIPYQQKRMFGFVTFVFPETVKLILARGNPHFVCDARVLVKPYKEKGKVSDNHRKQHVDREDFSGCNTPTAVDSRDTFDFQKFETRMLYSGISHDAFLRRNLEEQQELQHAIELDLKRNSSTSISASVCSSPSTFPITTSLASASLEAGQHGTETRPTHDSDFQECLEHNLPDSPFTSPTNSGLTSGCWEAEATTSASSTLLSSTLLPGTSSGASFKSCSIQMPRFSSSRAVGL